MKPTLVTLWYCPARLLEASLWRNRPISAGHEQWVINARYPLLSAKEAVTDVRSVQNACKELGVEYWQADQSYPRENLVKLWATETGKTPDQVVISLADDSAPSHPNWIEDMELGLARWDYVALFRATGKSSIMGFRMKDLANVYTAELQTGLSPYLKDLGGPAALGGCFEDSLYDHEQLEWLKADDGSEFVDWLEKHRS